ncbi:MAG: DUF2877 domain-containing protein [Hyphomicrobiaceae bacterium]
MTDQRAICVSVSHGGRQFIEMAKRHSRLTVVARFANVIHVAAGDDYGCLCDASVPCGPLNAVPEGPAKSIIAEAVIGQKIAFDVSQVRVYAPPAPRGHASRNARLERIAALRAFAITSAPPDGLAGPALDHALPPSAVTKLAVPRLDGFKRWLLMAVDPSDETMPPPPTSFVGFGPGLTPSGDDFICGALIALRACGRRSEAVALGSAAVEAARDTTTRFSRALLRAAAQGEAIEPLHHVVNAILDGSPALLEVHLKRLTAIGHTSGWDALAGVIVTLEAELQRTPSRSTVANALLTSLPSP